MPRRVYVFAVALSLLLSIASGSLWAWSYHTLELWEWIDFRGGIVAPGVPGWRGTPVTRSLNVSAAYGHAKFHWGSAVPEGTGVLLLGPDSGKVWFFHHRDMFNGPYYGEPPDNPSGFQAFELKKHDFSRLYYVHVLTIAFPLWLPTLLCAVLPCVYVCGRLRFRRSRDAARKPCLSCGYDLRATPGRCPECGVVPASG